MTTLRKKIFHSKIQNIISESKFVLFFQFNNVKFTDWIFLKNQIFNFQNINVIVIKNKISYKTFLNDKAKIEFFSPSNKTNLTEKYVEYKNHLSIEINKNLSFNKKKLNFLCQGPTLVIHLNSIDQCKAIYDILNQYTYNFFCTKSMHKPESFDLHKYEKSCLNINNLPLLFLQKKSNLYLQKQNFIKKKKYEIYFFFYRWFF